MSGRHIYEEGGIDALMAAYNDLEEAAQFVVDLFDPMPTKATVSPALLRAIAQGAKNANTSLREDLAEQLTLCKLCGRRAALCGHNEAGSSR